MWSRHPATTLGRKTGTRLPTLSTHWHHGGCTHPLMQGTKLRRTSEHAYNYETTLSWEPLSLCLFTNNYCRNISDYHQKNMWSKVCALLWVGVPSSLFHAGPHPTHYALIQGVCTAVGWGTLCTVSCWPTYCLYLYWPIPLAPTCNKAGRQQ